MAEALLMSGNAQSRAATPREGLDRDVAVLRDNAKQFARLGVADKIRLLRECMVGVSEVARDWVREACRAKGIDFASATSGEEWLGGPWTTMRNLRLLAESLEEIAASGRPRLGQGARTRPDGRVEVRVFPESRKLGALYAGFSAHQLMEKGATEATVRERQAAFYQRRDPEGGVGLILGAGNVSSIPPMDVFTKMFVEGEVALLKMNPVNEWVGPFLERALAPLVQAGFLRVVYGGGDVGAYLTSLSAIDDIHITGSDRTHDLIVWGPPGPERERRKKANDPVYKKRITSELGNVSPVAIVPCAYKDAELAFQARNVASMVTNNGSFNCNAAKILITGARWPQREKFLGLVREALAAAPTRKAYYPGALERYEALLAGHERVEKFGAPGAGELSWALVPGLDPKDEKERLFQTEPFCGILSETALDTGDAAEFLGLATKFMNERLWGTLNATIVISPRDERDPTVAAALDRAIVELEYGSICVNHWAALAYGFVTPAWGGHPSATLADIQSGLGWVHNTFMLEGIEKTVVRGPITVAPKPPWFFDNKRTHIMGEKLVRFEANPGWLKVPGLAITAMGG